jgi:hypothetical protein
MAARKVPEGASAARAAAECTFPFDGSGVVLAQAQNKPVAASNANKGNL